MSVKNLNLSCSYQPNIENLKKEQQTTFDVIENIYNRFMNEQNYNNKERALEALQNYRYVPNKYMIPNGRYVRYIDTTDHTNMPIKLGGFVLNDNKYSFVYKSASETQRIVRCNKRHCIMFVYITDDEKIRATLKNC